MKDAPPSINSFNLFEAKSSPLSFNLNLQKKHDLARDVENECQTTDGFSLASTVLHTSHFEKLPSQYKVRKTTSRYERAMPMYSVDQIKQMNQSD